MKDFLNDYANLNLIEILLIAFFLVSNRKNLLFYQRPFEE